VFIVYGFFLSNSTPTMAIAMIMTIVLMAKYVVISELDSVNWVEVDAGELDGADSTFAEVSPYELKYELVPANVA